jgi:archaellum component FlaC
MFKVNPQVKRKQTFNKTTNVLTSNMVTNQSKPYQQLKDDIEDLQKNISSLEKVNSNIA